MHHNYVLVVQTPFGPEDAIMPLAGKIEENGLDNKAPLSNKGKPKQKHKKNSHKKVIFMGMH